MKPRPLSLASRRAIEALNSASYAIAIEGERGSAKTYAAAHNRRTSALKKLERRIAYLERKLAEATMYGTAVHS